MYPLLHPSIHYHYVPTVSSIHFHPSIIIIPGRASIIPDPVGRNTGRENQAEPRHRAQSAKITERPETVTEVLGGGGMERPLASPGSPCYRPSKPPSQTKP
jgi:hypothetical protein